jgi:hypothetical protein
MEPISQVAVLTAASILAAAAAFALNWFFLRAALHLMQPAGATPARKLSASNVLPGHPDLVQATRAIARQFDAHR